MTVVCDLCLVFAFVFGDGVVVWVCVWVWGSGGEEVGESEGEGVRGVEEPMRESHKRAPYSSFVSGGC